jgi:hypothetical protein
MHPATAPSLYMARYSDGEGRLISHAVVCAVDPLHRSRIELEQWRNDWNKEMRLILDESPLDLALRTSVASGRFWRLLHLLGTHDTEDRVIDAALRLARLDGVTLCIGRDEQDRLAGALPDWRVWTEPEAFCTGAVGFACDFRLHRQTSPLLQHAARSGTAAAVQVNVRRMPASLDAVRAVRKNLLRLEQARVPSRSLSAQQAISDRLQTAEFFISEYAGFGSEAALREARASLDIAFRAEYSRFGFAEAPLAWGAGAAAEQEISTGLYPGPPGTEAGPLASASQAVTRAEILEILQWHPPEMLIAHVQQDSPRLMTIKIPIKVFISYAHEDEPYRKELEQGLALLKRQGLIQTWTDRDITPSMEWKGQIDANLEGAQIILLLVSSAFVNSDYAHDVEMKRAMERHRAGDARVIPIVVRPAFLDGAEFMQLQGLPQGLVPVSKWEDRDEAWTDVVRGINRLIRTIADHEGP